TNPRRRADIHIDSGPNSCGDGTAQEGGGRTKKSALSFRFCPYTVCGYSRRSCPEPKGETNAFLPYGPLESFFFREEGGKKSSLFFFLSLLLLPLLLLRVLCHDGAIRSALHDE